MLVPEGARAATASTRSSSSRGTGFGRKARIEWRDVIALLDVEDGDGRSAAHASSFTTCIRRVGQGDRPLCRTIDVDMDEMAAGRGLGRAGGEDADLVAHARAADPPDADAGLEGLRKRQRREVVAVRLDDIADHLAGGDVERAGFDQDAVDRGVEQRVVDDVVDVAVGVVVEPAGGERHEPAVGGARHRLRPVEGGGFVGSGASVVVHGRAFFHPCQDSIAARIVAAWIATVTSMSWP